MSLTRICAGIVLSSVAALAQSTDAGMVVNCAGGASLQAAIHEAPPNSTLLLRGACKGPVIVITDGLTLKGIGEASINGSAQDAVTVNGARRILEWSVLARHEVKGVIAVR